MTDSEEASEKRFVALAFPKISIDDVWTSVLDETMGSGADIRFHNRRGTGGDMHYATMTFNDPKDAKVVAEQLHPELYNHKKPVTALCSDHSDPTEVEVQNLALQEKEILRQFGSLGTIISSRIATRKMRSQLVFATHAQAKKCLQFDKKTFKGNVVEIIVKRDSEAGAAGEASETKATKKRVLKRRRTRNRLKLRSAQFAALPEHIKDKVLNYRQIKEKVIQNLADVRRSLSKPESEHTPEGLAVIRGEEERLLLKQKKLRKALRKEISAYRI
eukprot:TRINITY_DN18287_c0_g1_i1.p1 TRINITY_DN18287_c0_g1~~TRINITY_DN18287_c0_g1_i1.p1  ORF type:complete len:293 (+),score=69.97 TRINITY_DN18287_c0_g1_i1:59-880(+)